jgi:hypothetical protein
MPCYVRIYYDAIGVPGTPSAGTNYLDQHREIEVPDGNWIGEWLPGGTGFGPCPSIQQWITRARNPATGEILAQANSSTCHNLNWKRYENTCPASTSYDCINGACISKVIYNTPGMYESLEVCETACGTGCSGKCISNSDWVQIEGLANKLKQKNCS